TFGIRFCNPPVDGKILDFRLPEPGAVPGLVVAGRIVDPGAIVRLPPRGFMSRFAYVICRAESPEACDEAMDAAAALVEVDVEPEAVCGPASHECRRLPTGSEGRCDGDPGGWAGRPPTHPVMPGHGPGGSCPVTGRAGHARSRAGRVMPGHGPGAGAARP